MQQIDVFRYFLLVRFVRRYQAFGVGVGELNFTVCCVGGRSVGESVSVREESHPDVPSLRS